MIDPFFNLLNVIVLPPSWLMSWRVIPCRGSSFDFLGDVLFSTRAKKIVKVGSINFSRTSVGPTFLHGEDKPILERGIYVEPRYIHESLHLVSIAQCNKRHHIRAT